MMRIVVDDDIETAEFLKYLLSIIVWKLWNMKR